MLRPYKRAAIHSLHLRRKVICVAQFYVRAVRWEFCTCVHRFAQNCNQILIDGENGRDYFASQIEPGSLRTLRINLEGVANLTVAAPRD
jgi:hypothetical protein